MRPLLGQREILVGIPSNSNPRGKLAGFISKTVTGEEKDFFHWRNSRWELNKLTKFCSLLYLVLGVEIQVGPAVDAKHLVKTNEVKILKNAFGLYVESGGIGILHLVAISKTLQDYQWGPKCLRCLPKNVRN